MYIKLLVLVLLHFCSLFCFFPFRLLLTDIWGGWACFTCSIIMIGVLTAVIGDLASSFGCTVGLKDAVTAISFVALGTSVPGKISKKLVLQRALNLCSLYM